MENKFTDNSKEFLDKLDAAKQRALEAIGMTVEKYAKQRLTDTVYSQTDIDYKLTGRLRNSITHDVRGDDVFIGTDVEYAAGIELGTHRKKGAVHYLGDAATQHTPEYKGILEAEYKNG